MDAYGYTHYMFGQTYNSIHDELHLLEFRIGLIDYGIKPAIRHKLILQLATAKSSLVKNKKFIKQVNATKNFPLFYIFKSFLETKQPIISFPEYYHQFIKHVPSMTTMDRENGLIYFQVYANDFVEFISMAHTMHNIKILLGDK